MLPDYTGQPWSTYKNQYAGPRTNHQLRRNYAQARNAYQPPAPPQQPAMPTYQYQQPAAGQSDLTAHPFFDPNANYGTDPRQQQGLTPGSAQYMNYASEQAPEAYYYGMLNERGLGGIDAKSQAAQSMYRDYARGYQSAKMKNQELWFPQYMQMQDPNAMISQMSNQQLGIDDNLYAGRDRWSLRGY